MTWREEHCPRSAPEACCPPSSTSHVPGQRAAPGLSTTHGIGHPGLRPSPHPARPRPAAPSRVGPQRSLGGGSQVREDPDRLPGQTESPAPPSSTWTRDTVSLTRPHRLTHSHAHTGSHTHTLARPHGLARTLLTGSHPCRSCPARPALTAPAGGGPGRFSRTATPGRWRTGSCGSRAADRPCE